MPCSVEVVWLTYFYGLGRRWAHLCYISLDVSNSVDGLTFVTLDLTCYAVNTLFLVCSISGFLMFSVFLKNKMIYTI